MSVRIGFIGAGGIAIAHLAALATSPAAEVVALCDISQQALEASKRSVLARLAETAADAPETRDALRRIADAVPYTDYRQMLRNERPDAVYVCLPPFAHGDPEEAVLEAGIPMLVEKPVALDLPTAARIWDGIRKRDLLVATGYQTRYATYLDRAKQLLTGRTVGMALVTRFGKTPGVSWYHRQDKSGGQVTEMATHQVDLLRHLIGEVRTVYAAAATRINHRERADYDIFDVNCMTMTFENGAVANFAVNFVCEPGSPLQGAGVHIFCDGLSLTLDSRLRVFSADGTEEVESEAPTLELADAAFVRAVAENRPELIRSDYANAVRNLAVTIANDRSARSGRPVDVETLLADEAPTVPLSS